MFTVAGTSCNLLSAPDNGMIDCSLGGDGVPTAGDTCRFTCNDGFEISGSQARRCRIRNNRGRWTGNQATCNMGIIQSFVLSCIYASILNTITLLQSQFTITLHGSVPHMTKGYSLYPHPSFSLVSYIISITMHLQHMLHII